MTPLDRTRRDEMGLPRRGPTELDNRNLQPLASAIARTPGYAYEGRCVNCGAYHRSALFFSQQGVEPPETLEIKCQCRLGYPVVELERRPGVVTAHPEILG